MLPGKVLRNKVVLRDCGFDPLDSINDSDDNHLNLEDLQYSRLMGHAVLTLLGLRIKKGAWYGLGWPHSFSAALYNQEWEKATARRFTATCRTTTICSPLQTPTKRS